MVNNEKREERKLKSDTGLCGGMDYFVQTHAVGLILLMTNIIVNSFSNIKSLANHQDLRQTMALRI